MVYKSAAKAKISFETHRLILVVVPRLNIFPSIDVLVYWWDGFTVRLGHKNVSQYTILLLLHLYFSRLVDEWSKTPGNIALNLLFSMSALLAQSPCLSSDERPLTNPST